MKKLFVLFAAATLLVGFQACKHNEETATEETAVVEEAPAVEAAPEVEAPATEETPEVPAAEGEAPAAE